MRRHYLWKSTYVWISVLTNHVGFRQHLKRLDINTNTWTFKVNFFAIFLFFYSVQWTSNKKSFVKVIVITVFESTFFFSQCTCLVSLSIFSFQYQLEDHGSIVLTLAHVLVTLILFPTALNYNITCLRWNGDIEKRISQRQILYVTQATLTPLERANVDARHLFNEVCDRCLKTTSIIF